MSVVRNMYRRIADLEVQALQLMEGRDAALAEAQKLRAELARVRETLSDLYHQHKCGCGHPACRSCGRDRDVEAALSQPAAPDSDLPLIAWRPGMPQRPAKDTWQVNGVTYLIADIDERGLPVVERTAETPDWAKYTGNFYRQFAREYQSWMHAKGGWRRIEDYNAYSESAQRKGS